MSYPWEGPTVIAGEFCARCGATGALALAGHSDRCPTFRGPDATRLIEVGTRVALAES